eukprot:TRINITY_DN6623_c0_g1_i2.p2 TRINITY_DN6623_c0_g1~~TRINITY_DN6623_c0_g1_i2.p2  ORF type:complete len:260 (-),score=46.71 TRINITY_DN6623_c0_g1_i2:136-915(-)
MIPFILLNVMSLVLAAFSIYLQLEKKAFEGDIQDEVIKINRECKINYKQCQHLSKDAQDLLKKMLDPDPISRISSAQALQHAFICQEQEYGADFPSNFNEIDLDFEENKWQQDGTLIDSFGSLHQKKVILNGRVDTLENMGGENCLSNSSLKKPGMPPMKKQSSYGKAKMAEALKLQSKEKQEQFEQQQKMAEIFISSPTKKQDSHNIMHKKAIMNTMIQNKNEIIKLSNTGKSNSFKLSKDPVKIQASSFKVSKESTN